MNVHSAPDDPDDEQTLASEAAADAHGVVRLSESAVVLRGSTFAWCEWVCWRHAPPAHGQQHSARRRDHVLALLRRHEASCHPGLVHPPRERPLEELRLPL